MRTWEVLRPYATPGYPVSDWFGPWPQLRVVDDRGNPQIHTWVYAVVPINPDHVLRHGWPYLEAVVLDVEVRLLEHSGVSGVLHRKNG